MPSPPVTCRICCSNQTWMVATPSGDFVRCRQCHSLFRPLTAEQYSKLECTYDPGPIADLAEPRAMRKFLGIEEKKDLLRPLVKNLRCRKILDVGCGAGGHLAAGQELGCEVRGVEPSEPHSRIARLLGFSVDTRYYEDGMFPAESYGLVIMSHVIEHILDPRAFLLSLYKLVQPGGAMLVVTPNADSLVARVSGPHWAMLRPLDHVSMLSARSFHAIGVEDWGKASYQQSEWIWEPAASILAAVVGAARATLRPSQRHPAYRKHQTPKLSWHKDRALLRCVLGVTGWPLHALAITLRRQACLTVLIEKPQTGGPS